MVNNQLTQKDNTLIEHAQQYLKKVFSPEKTYVVALIQTVAGSIYKGFNIKAYSGKASVCAEALALAQVLKAKDVEAQTLVVVAYDPELNTPIVISPCGSCRDLLREHLPHINVIIQDASLKFLKIPIKSLLPYPYTQ